MQAIVKAVPLLAGKSPGVQLGLALTDLFRQTMPPTPPHQDGKRLDTRWGRFGLLAASYFAPLLYGRPYPRSMRKSWRRIDPAILLFVYGKPADELRPEQIKPYELVGNELDMPADSTISDWHRVGIDELAAAFLNREQHLSLSMGRPSAVLEADGGVPEGASALKQGTGATAGAVGVIWHWGRFLLLAAVLLAAVFAGVKGYRLYQTVQAVRQDVTDLSKLDPASLQLDSVKQIGSLLARTERDVQSLKAQAAPWLPVAGGLGWVPVYGGDLTAAGDVLEVGSAVTEAADQTYQTMLPIVDALQQKQDLGGAALTQMFIDTRPSLLKAQALLEQATAARQRIDVERLSPGVRDLVGRVDPYLPTFTQSLSLALSVPDLLGGTATGPKTYLILVQNEDELRATGGFITAVGKVVVRNGGLMDLKFEDSYAVDDMQKPYPAAPWQMQSFMNIPVMVFRDANWFVNYPTAAEAAEYLYAYTNDYSVDGVIAIDQHVLETILSVTGPVNVGGLDTTVTANNVQTLMRTQKIPPAAEQGDPDWQRKHFINPIAAGILQRLISGHGVSWERLLRAMLAELDQRHILVQLDDPTLTTFLAERGWDGAVRAPAGDFLMVVDTNVGYNKTNAVVSSHLTYDVDLTDTAQPRSSLSVFQQNDAKSVPGPCVESPPVPDKTTLDAWYPIDRCYYDYLRVYVPAGTQLTAATPHPVSRAEMLTLDADVPARVDLLDENIQDVTGFGTLLVVPTQGSLATSFDFSPPAAILQAGTQSCALVYRLKIQKQPGTVAVPVTVRVHLPHGSQVELANKDFVQDGDSLLFNLDLRTDVNLEVEFRR